MTDMESLEAGVDAMTVEDMSDFNEGFKRLELEQSPPPPSEMSLDPEEKEEEPKRSTVDLGSESEEEQEEVDFSRKVKRVVAYYPSHGVYEVQVESGKGGGEDQIEFWPAKKMDKANKAAKKKYWDERLNRQ